MTRLLIVEDEKIQREYLRELLLRKGWEVQVAGSLPEAERKLAAGPFDVVLTDVRLAHGELGTDLLGRCGEARVVVMSAYGSVDSAVAAMKLGAVDYVTKPFDDEDLFARLARAAPPKPAAVVEKMLLGESALMRTVQDRVRRIAASDLSVLVIGESGTGKRLAARAVHQQSARHTGPFVPFPCAEADEDLVTRALLGHESGAVPGATEARAGLFESASGGTVFLDEVGRLSSFAQDRLLNVLEHREVQRIGAARAQRIDVRIVAATKLDLQALVQEQKFSDALYYHLKDPEVRLPRLRERGDDLFLLARRTIDAACASMGRPPVRLSTAAREAMLAYAWPGNVRELEKALQSALWLFDSEEIEPQHLPATICERPQPKPGSIDDYTKRTILENQDRLVDEKLAALLGISRETLIRFRNRYGIQNPRGRGCGKLPP
jgi:two-component system response regulator AtoC